MLPHGATSSADSQETRQKRGKDKRKDKTYPPKHTLAQRRLWRGQLFAAVVLFLVWSETSGARSIFRSGATQEATGLTAAEFCRGCASGTVQAALPMESRSQADSEATGVKIDEDSSQDWDKGSSKEVVKLH